MRLIRNNEQKRFPWFKISSKLFYENKDACKNKVQIVPKITHAKKDMWFMETWSRNTIATFNAK